MIAVDTNSLLRYLLCPIDRNNPKWQVEKAQSLIHQASKVLILDIVIVETEWVLEAVFHCCREEIHTLISTLATNSKFQFEDWTALNQALLDYKEHCQIDLSDCFIARRANSLGANMLYTLETTKKPGALPVVTSITKHSHF